MIREELILQYFNNELSKSDMQLVMEWAAKNPEDFQLSKEIWEHSNSAKEIRVFNVEDEWSTFMDMMEVQEAAPEVPVIEEVPISEEKVEDRGAAVVPISRWNEWRPVVATAAMFILVATAYFLWPRNSEVVHFAAAEGDKIELSDKTVVTLEEGATIKYLKSFEGQEKRIVKLDGIATFDVAHDPDSPFIVQTSNSGVKALGTVFIVDGSSESSTGVENVEGLIRFFDIVVESKFKDVKEGESFVYDGSDFKETTVRPEPIIRRFEAPAIPKSKSPTIAEVINYLYRISNGHTVYKGDDFDWNKRVDVKLNTTDVDVIFDRLALKTRVVKLKKNCSDCYEIKSVRVNR